jgi:quinol monooxygenase YgiN
MVCRSALKENVSWLTSFFGWANYDIFGPYSPLVALGSLYIAVSLLFLAYYTVFSPRARRSRRSATPLRPIIFSYCLITGLFNLVLLGGLNKFAVVAAAFHNLVEWLLILHQFWPRTEAAAKYKWAFLWIWIIVTVVSCMIDDVIYGFVFEQIFGIWCDIILWITFAYDWFNEHNGLNRGIRFYPMLASALHMVNIVFLALLGAGLINARTAQTIIMLTIGPTFYLYAEYSLLMDERVCAPRDENDDARQDDDNNDGEDDGEVKSDDTRPYRRTKQLPKKGKKREPAFVELATRSRPRDPERPSSVSPERNPNILPSGFHNPPCWWIWLISFIIGAIFLAWIIFTPACEFSCPCGNCTVYGMTHVIVKEEYAASWQTAFAFVGMSTLKREQNHGNLFYHVYRQNDPNSKQVRFLVLEKYENPRKLSDHLNATYVTETFANQSILSSLVSYETYGPFVDVNLCTPGKAIASPFPKYGQDHYCEVTSGVLHVQVATADKNQFPLAQTRFRRLVNSDKTAEFSFVLQGAADLEYKHDAVDQFAIVSKWKNPLDYRENLLKGKAEELSQLYDRPIYIPTVKDLGVWVLLQFC